MIDILIRGIKSNIGNSLYKRAISSDNFNVICGIDNVTLGEFDCQVYKSYDQVKNDVDVVVDFSEEPIYASVEFALKKKCALILGSSVLSDKEQKCVETAEKEIPIFMSSNFSIAVNLIAKFASETAREFANYDVEIIDISGANKTYSPSATATLFANTIKEVKDIKKIAYGRKGNGKRNENEIGIHSVRGGGLLGAHKVMFIGPDETITFEHEAGTADLYAKGALKACEYIVTKKNGFYTMKNYLKDAINK